MVRAEKVAIFDINSEIKRVNNALSELRGFIESEIDNFHKAHNEYELANNERLSEVAQECGITALKILDKFDELLLIDTQDSEPGGVDEGGS
jgi:hypothetical protein